jgi:hypothetical protein
MVQEAGGEKKGQLSRIEFIGCRIAFLSLKDFPSR